MTIIRCNLFFAKLLFQMNEDKHVVQIFLDRRKVIVSKQLLKLFPEKRWTLGGLNNLIHKNDNAAVVRRKSEYQYSAFESTLNSPIVSYRIVSGNNNNNNKLNS